MTPLALPFFSPITISELGNALLMERVDRKYHLPLKSLDDLLTPLIPYYNVLEVGGHRLTTYDTFYYDTDSLDCYHQHHNQRGARFKVRHRHYVESSTAFWEVKARNNKKRTLKTRISSELNAFESQEFQQLIRTHSPFQVDMLRPGLQVKYQRITLVNPFTAERITIDLHLQFVLGEQTCAFPGLVIVEVKQNKFSDSPMVSALRRLNIRPGGLSKYCFGLAYLNPDLKQNLFKLRLKQLLNSANAPLTARYTGKLPRAN